MSDSTPLGCVHLTPSGYNLVYKELGKKMFPGVDLEAQETDSLPPGTGMVV